MASSFNAIQIALIYGSYVGNALRPESDIDIPLVVTDTGVEDAIVERLSGIERRISREVNYTTYTAREFQRKRSTQEPFLSEILSGKPIALKGGL